MKNKVSEQNLQHLRFLSTPGCCIGSGTTGGWPSEVTLLSHGVDIGDLGSSFIVMCSSVKIKHKHNYLYNLYN